jgi:uncharacterized membrane protein HdeD (DUF308 family)
VAAAAALAVTFSADHSTSLGYLIFGLFAVLSAAVVIISSAFGSETRVVRTFRFAQGGVMLIAGGIALLVPSGGLPFLIFLVALFAIASGFLELYLGIRGRRKESAWRDAVFTGALTVGLAVVVLLVPPGFAQPFTGPDGVPRQLTASVIIVGLLGAYWAICAVYLIIAGLSLRWSTHATPQSSAAPTAVPQERPTP